MADLVKDVKHRISNRARLSRDGKAKVCGLPSHYYSWFKLTQKRKIKQYRKIKDKREVCWFIIMYNSLLCIALPSKYVIFIAITQIHKFFVSV